MNSMNFRNKELTYTPSKRVKNEKSFELPIPALVSGEDATGAEFLEQSKLSSISSQQATFLLDAEVTIGSKLNLALDIPKTNILENQLRLLLTGTVVYVKGETNLKKKQLISIRLDKKYKLRPIILQK